MNNRKYPSLLGTILMMTLCIVGIVGLFSQYVFPSIFHFIEKKIPIDYFTLWITALLLIGLSMGVFVYGMSIRYIRKAMGKSEQDNNDQDTFLFHTHIFKGNTNKITLKQVHANLSAILNEMHVAMLILAHDDTIAYYNKAIEKIYPNIHAYIGKPYTQVIQKKSLQKHILSLQNDIAHRTTEMIINNIVYIVSISNLAHMKMRIIMFSEESISKELKIMKNDFIANTSHELKTPITTIKGYVDLLKEEPHNVEKYIPVIDRNTDRIIRIINNLLILSKLESTHLALHYEKFALDTLIKDVGYYFENTLKKKKLKLKIKLHRQPLYIEADKVKIQELLTNLLDNAVKYTDSGTIGIHTSYDYGELVIVIRDTGIGISSKYHARIFERFFVVDRSRFKEVIGVGLGLSIVKQIVQLHKGKISVASKPGIGTNITIRMPVKKPHS